MRANSSIWLFLISYSIDLLLIIYHCDYWSLPKYSIIQTNHYQNSITYYLYNQSSILQQISTIYITLTSESTQKLPNYNHNLISSKIMVYNIIISHITVFSFTFNHYLLTQKQLFYFKITHYYYIQTMNARFVAQQERGSQHIDIGIWACLFTKKWSPKLSFASTLIIFFILGAIFAISGIFMFYTHMKVSQFHIPKYDLNQNCSAVLGTQSSCTLSIVIPQFVKAPIYFTYELTNFFQNHRRYIQSKNTNQLEGKIIDFQQAERSCEPIVRNQDLNTRYAWDGKTLLDPMAVANPCGLIAKSYFNDTYRMFYPNGNEVFINETGIAWLNDKVGKYRRSYNSSSIQWMDPQNQHFIVWMRTAGTPHFSKLWGRIESDLPAGTYSIKVKNNFNIRLYNGNKNIVLTTTSIFGGKNIYMPMAYFVISAVCFLICGIFIYKNRSTEGKFGEKRRQ